MISDFLQEFASYPDMAAKMMRFKAGAEPEKVFYGTDRRQYYLHFAPEGPGRETVVVYIHGGGWNKGSPAFFSFIGHCFAAAGYRCVMPGYRLAPFGHFPDITEDVCVGTRAALAHLDALGVDARRVAVVGSSAGAHLGALLCYDEALAEKFGVPAERFCGFAGLGGPYRFDFDPTLSVQVLSRNMLGDHDPVEAQPYYCLHEGQAVPMLVIHGVGDGVVDYATGAEFYHKALSLGIPARFFVPPAGEDAHSVYVSGCFLERREECPTLDALFTWLEEL